MKNKEPVSDTSILPVTACGKLKKDGTLTQDREKNPIKNFFKKIYSLIISSSSSPGQLARGACIGTFIALTPTVGIQILAYSLLWGLLRGAPRLSFDYRLGFAFIWLTNYFTVIPLYFIFYYTGIPFSRLFLNADSPATYSEFSALWQPVLDQSFFAAFSSFIQTMGSIIIPLLVGSLPYAVILSFLAYQVTWRVSHKRQLSGVKN